MDTEGLESALETLIATIRHDAARPAHLALAADPARHRPPGGAARHGDRRVDPPRRFDLVSATMGWPAYLRGVVRRLLGETTTLVFIFVISVVRIGDPDLGRAPAHLHSSGRRQSRHRLVGHQPAGGTDPQQADQPHRRGDGLDHRGAQHPQPARRHRGSARRPRHRARRLADHAAARAQDRGAAGGGALGGNHDQQLPRPPRQERVRADAVDPGAARQAHPHRDDGGRRGHRDELGRASTCRCWRCSPVRSASASASACRRSSRTSSAASFCWPTSRSSRAT